MATTGSERDKTDRKSEAFAFGAVECLQLNVLTMSDSSKLSSSDNNSCT